MIFNIVCYEAFNATVTVTCPSGTTSCTLTKSGSTATLVSQSGLVYTFRVTGTSAKGTWTATASNGSKTTTGTKDVQNSATNYTLTLDDYPSDGGGGGGDDPTPESATLIVNWATGQYCWLTDPDGNYVFELDTSGYWRGTPAKIGLYSATCSNADPTDRKNVV